MLEWVLLTSPGHWSAYSAKGEPGTRRERALYWATLRRLLRVKTDISWLTFSKYGHCWLPVPPPLPTSQPLCALPTLPGLSCSEPVAACLALTLKSCCVYTCIHLQGCPCLGLFRQGGSVQHHLGKHGVGFCKDTGVKAPYSIIIVAFQYTCGCQIRSHITRLPCSW